ncbi:hypothetical protein T492DRAFT_884711 [Pavlovales sp. CCMP2436]|nr:hypothetical protein T492DRAFT_884711 [Pavlovales sp. CCMP2436]
MTQVRKAAETFDELLRPFCNRWAAEATAAAAAEAGGEQAAAAGSAAARLQGAADVSPCVRGLVRALCSGLDGARAHTTYACARAAGVPHLLADGAPGALSLACASARLLDEALAVLADAAAEGRAPEPSALGVVVGRLVGAGRARDAADMLAQQFRPLDSALRGGMPGDYAPGVRA